MNRRSLTLIAAGVALALAGSSTLVLAESAEPAAEAVGSPEGGPPGGPASEHGPGMMGRMMGKMMDHHGPGGDPHQHFKMMCETGDAHHAAMLAYAEVRLKLTEAQKPAWAKFVEATKVAHLSMTKLCADLKDKPAPTTLPERLASAEQFAQAHLNHLQAIRPAVTELYGQLSPEQRKLADSLRLGIPGPHGHGHHMQ